MHVVVNAAMSVDGKLSSRRREQIAISGPDDFDRVDRLRAASDGVMVGVGTVLADDPSLTLDDASLVAERTERGESPQPARIGPSPAMATSVCIRPGEPWPAAQQSFQRQPRNSPAPTRCWLRCCRSAPG